jgi:hypothetical protein
MTPMRPWALWLALVACAYEPADFDEDYATAWCTYQATCDPPFEPTDADCREDLREDPLWDDTCPFDEEQARACIDALDGLICEGPARNFPTEACRDVYRCP